MARLLIATNTPKYFRMKKYVSLFLFSLFYCTIINAQQIYKVADFSDKYEAEIRVPEYYDYNESHYYDDNDDTTGISKLPTVLIIDKQTGKILIDAKAHLDISYDINDDGLIKSNVLEMPYGDQSAILCDDFNCDDEEDIAIKIGNLSCYGGPAYVVYTAKGGKLELDEALSELAQNYCGFFDYDCDQREIRTMTKSGYGWHQYSTYKITDGKVSIREVIVDDHRSILYPETIITTFDDEGKETIKIYANTDNIEVILSFELAKNKKKVLVLNNLQGLLSYCFLKEDGEVEFDFGEDFYLSKEEDKDILTFSNDSAKYSIYCSDKEVGVVVVTNGKTYDMKGVLSTKKNSLKALYNTEDLENLHLKEDLE